MAVLNQSEKKNWQNCALPWVETLHLFWVKAPLSQGRSALLCSKTAWQISHENEWFDDFFFIFVIFFPIGTFFSNLLHTFELK